MAQDFAKRKRKKPVRRKSQRKKKNELSTRPVWFGTGMACGLFLAFLLQLGGKTLFNGDEQRRPTAAIKSPDIRSQVSERMPEEQQNDPRFEFYEVLPGQNLKTNSDSKTAYQTREEINDFNTIYLLQAGSFENRTDAETLRATITLLNLAANTEAARLGSGALTHRVYIGPYKKKADMQAARSTLHREGIETLLREKKVSRIAQTD